MRAAMLLGLPFILVTAGALAGSPEGGLERWGAPEAGVSLAVPSSWMLANCYGPDGKTEPSVIEREGSGIRCSAWVKHQPLPAGEPPSLQAFLDGYREQVLGSSQLEGPTVQVAELRQREDGLSYFIVEFGGVAAGGFRMRFRAVGFFHAGRLVRLESQVEEDRWERTRADQDGLLASLRLGEPQPPKPKAEQAKPKADRSKRGKRK